MTLLDALARIEEAAGKANSLPMKVNRYDHGGGRFWTELDGKRNLIADFYEEGDRELFALLTPERIKALIEVARAARAALDGDIHSFNCPWEFGRPCDCAAGKAREALKRLEVVLQ